MPKPRPSTVAYKSPDKINTDRNEKLTILLGLNGGFCKQNLKDLGVRLNSIQKQLTKNAGYVPKEEIRL